MTLPIVPSLHHRYFLLAIYKLSYNVSCLHTNRDPGATLYKKNLSRRQRARNTSSRTKKWKKTIGKLIKQLKLEDFFSWSHQSNESVDTEALEAPGDELTSKPSNVV